MYIFCGATMHHLEWIHSEHMIEHLAEYGLVFLLFTLGLEFSLPKLIRLKGKVFGLGLLQVGAVSSALAIILLFLGLPFVTAIVCAVGLAFSSTAILIKELKKKNKLNSEVGERVVAILLFQDLVAMAILLILPCIPNAEGDVFFKSLFFALTKGILLFAILMAVGQWVLPRVLNEISASESDELFVLVTLVISLAAAWLTDKLGLSMALGGFLIGMMLAESKHAHQVEKEIRPFRDLLLGVFFVSIGMKVDLGLLLTDGLNIFVFACALVLIKAVSMMFVLKLRGNTNRNSFELSLYLAQGGEFGFAILSLATSYELISVDGASQYLSIIILSMACSPVMFYVLKLLDPKAKTAS